MKRVVLIGDEEGLKSLFKSIKSNGRFLVSGVICHKGRAAAEEVAADISNSLGCNLIRQPRRSEENEYGLFVDKIRECKADFAVCYSYDMILKKEVLDIFPQGVYNLHGALLPKYRGGSVLNWVIINGEKETGMTIHRMEETVDTGPIVMQKRVTIDYDDTALTLRKKLSDVAEELLIDFWQEAADNSIILTPQNEEEASSFRRRKPEDGFFEWSWEPERIYNLIRALISPWPGAFYYENGEKVVINHFLTFDEVKKIKAEKEKG